MRDDPGLIIDPMARRKKKNRHGDGSHRKRGRHSWQLRWMVEGVASSETVRGSEADARVKLKRRTAEAAEGIMPEGLMRRTVGDIVRWRVERYERERPASFGAIWTSMSRILADGLAAVRVVKLRRRDIEKFQDRLAESGLAAASVNRYVSLVTAALRAAAAEDPPLVTHVPRVSPLKADNARQGFLLAADYGRLMGCIGPEWLKLLFAIGYHVGARAGSILAAKWEQVDWEKKIIRPPGNQPKNKKVGFWPVYGDLEKRLREAEFHREKYWPHVPWLIHKDGRRLTEASQYHSAWHKAVKDAGTGCCSTTCAARPRGTCCPPASMSRPSAASSGGRTRTCSTAIGSWTNLMFPMSAGRRRGTWSHSKAVRNGKTRRLNERH